MPHLGQGAPKHSPPATGRAPCQKGQAQLVWHRRRGWGEPSEAPGSGMGGLAGSGEQFDLSSQTMRSTDLFQGCGWGGREEGHACLDLITFRSWLLSRWGGWWPGAGERWCREGGFQLNLGMDRISVGTHVCGYMHVPR